MPLLIEELFICPICSANFMSKVLAAYNTFGPLYSDLYTASEEDPQPILHFIHICPRCGFAAFTDDYREFNLDPETVKQAIKKVEELVNKKATEFNAGDGFLQIAEYRQGRSLEERSFIVMQACHAYRELKDKNVSLARKIALVLIEEILEKKVFKEKPEELYLYLAGEICRLLDNQHESLDYFKLVLEKAGKESVFLKLAIHQLANPKEIVPKKFD